LGWFYRYKTNPLEFFQNYYYRDLFKEAGFDTVAPNINCIISSWAFDKVITNSSINILDNRAVDIPCYLPTYTLVEKLQTIARKFRLEQEGKGKEINYMRQYYDVHCLLNIKEVQEFVGTPEYLAHKDERFSKADLSIPINKSEAFLLTNVEVRKDFTTRYIKTKALYYQSQPDFEEILRTIQKNIDKL
jgi:hypothetical protein